LFAENCLEAAVLHLTSHMTLLDDTQGLSNMFSSIPSVLLSEKPSRPDASELAL
jgi:hypothetical protein